MKTRVCLRYFVNGCRFNLGSNMLLKNKTFNNKIDTKKLYPHHNGIT